jgi:hypothetical protein
MIAGRQRTWCYAGLSLSALLTSTAVISERHADLH